MIGIKKEGSCAINTDNVAEGSTVIGILGVQGAFLEHQDALRRLDPSLRTLILRKPEDWSTRLDGLILPGGESTAQAIVAKDVGLMPLLKDFVHAGKPVMGTCAGLILLSDQVLGQKEGGQPLIGGLRCRLLRNFYGTQRQSFLAPLELVDPQLSETSLEGVFIRAPLIESIGETGCSVLAYLNRDEKKQIVAVRQGNILGLTFHPELTDSLVWHNYFIQMIRKGND